MNDLSPLADVPASILLAELRRRIFHGLLDPALEDEAAALLARAEDIERAN